MAAPFKCDDKVTIEHNVGVQEETYGTVVPVWQPLFINYWANVQDLLPSKSEKVSNGLARSIQSTRLRMRINSGMTAEMRVVLHSRGNRIMQIVSGPARLDDGVHEEWMLEGDTKNG